MYNPGTHSMISASDFVFLVVDLSSFFESLKSLKGLKGDWCLPLLGLLFIPPYLSNGLDTLLTVTLLVGNGLETTTLLIAINTKHL